MLYKEIVFKSKSGHICEPDQYNESKSKWSTAEYSEFDNDYEFLYDDLYEICEYGCGRCCSEMIKGVIDSYPLNKRLSIANKLKNYIYNQKEDEESLLPPSLSFMFNELRYHPEFDKIYPRKIVEDYITNLSSPKVTSSFEIKINTNLDDFKYNLESCYNLLRDRGYIDTSFLRFIKVFKNEKIDQPVIWKESMTSLYYFMKELTSKDKNIIKIPSDGIWKVTAYCFITKTKEPFIVNHKTKVSDLSIKAKKDINKAIEYLLK